MTDNQQPQDDLEGPEEFVELAPRGLLSTGPDGTILAANDTFSRWTGYGRSELIGVQLYQLFTKPSQIYYHTHYEPLLRLQGYVHEIAVDIVRRDKQLLPAFVNAEEKRRPDGSVALLRVAVFAATERRKYERELHRARARERGARGRAHDGSSRRAQGPAGRGPSRARAAQASAR